MGLILPSGAPITATSLAPLLAHTNVVTGARINALGDSIVSAYVNNAQYTSATYQMQLANNVHAWTSGTAYVVGNLVKSGGYSYRCTTAGTAGATAPSGIISSGSPFSDGGASWVSSYTLDVFKGGQHMLSWAEIFDDRLNFDMSLGYGGIDHSVLKIIVVNGGSNYTAPVLVGSSGATGTIQTAGGVITGVTITNPGYSSTGAFTFSITDTTGSGAVLSWVLAGSGTFGVPGCLTTDMVARLPDVVAALPNICVVHGGTNDASSVSAGTDAQVTTAINTAITNLRTCYETLMLAGIKVIAVPITPISASLMTQQKATFIQRVNRWIRAYCSNRSWANPLGFSEIALADPTGYWTDGTLSYGVIGGNGGVLGALTVDGLHNANRGAQYTGYCVAKAAERWLGGPQTYSARSYSWDDGYDPTQNPSGNMNEGPPWRASTAVAIGAQCMNGTNVYICTQAGTTASSGGPTGTGTGITDGTAKWSFMSYGKCSVFASATNSLTSIVSGVTSGVIAAGWYLSRHAGSATGSVVGSIESPWSNGQNGQRQVFTFSLGSGTATERWDVNWATNNIAAYALRNIQPSDLGVTQFIAETEFEISNVANLTRLNINLASGDADKVVNVGPAIDGAGYEWMNSSGDQLVSDLGGYPHNGRILLRSEPFILPPNLVNMNFSWTMSFNASGAAGSATATIKVNYAALRKYGVV